MTVQLTAIWAHLNGATLDLALSDGDDPASSPALAQRSSWLTSPGSRHRLARAVRHLLDPVEARHGRSAAVTLNRRGVEAARDSFTWIAGVLESERPINPRGAARLHLLLTDADSALYDPNSGEQLVQEAQEIFDALEGREETW